jgi:hypothetical protein
MAGGGGWGGYGGTPPPPGAGWAAPPPGMPPGYTPSGGGSAPLATGVPWDHPGGFFGKWWDTMKAANFDSRSFFAAARQKNDALGAVLFNVTTSALLAIAFVVGFIVFFTTLTGVVVTIFSSYGHALPSGLAPLIGLGLGYIVAYALFYAVLIVAGGFVGPWVYGGLHHLFLMLFKGTHPSLEYQHTVRAHAFAVGAAAAWSFVPCVGPLVAIVFFIKNLVQAYDETHLCGTGKALGAIFAPVLCCCLCMTPGWLLSVSAWL